MNRKVRILLGSWVKYVEGEMMYFWTYWVWRGRNIKIFRKHPETWIWNSERSGMKLWEPVTDRCWLESRVEEGVLGAPAVRGQEELVGWWVEVEITEQFIPWKSNSREPLERRNGQQSVCYIFGWNDLPGKISKLKDWINWGKVLE